MEEKKTNTNKKTQTKKYYPPKMIDEGTKVRKRRWGNM